MLTPASMPVLLERAMAAAGAGFVIADITTPDYPIVYANPGFTRLTGYTAEECLGRNCRFLQGPTTDAAAIQTMSMAVQEGQECRLTLRNYRRDGSSFWNEVWLSPIHDEEGTVVQYLGVQQDVTARVEAEQRISHLAYHDSLTGLLNRQALERRLDDVVADAERAGEALAVLYIDLDGFKAINDAHGHAAGDHVLREVAARLTPACRPGDLVARHGGDEFIVLLPSLREQPDAVARTVSERIAAALAPPHVINGQRLTVGASVGAALFPRDASNSQGLLDHADKALYSRKRSDPGRVRPGTGNAADLAEILHTRAVEPVFQPLVELESGAIRGYEALARGPHGHPLERPDRLFAAAREAGRLAELDALCRRRAIEVADRAGLRPPLSLFINVEPATVSDEMAEDPAILGRDGTVWEITERALTARPAELIRLVERIREAGSVVALDDVGADIRSLALLPLLGPDVVKLDLRLIQQQPTEEIASIVNAVAAYREQTGATIVAEGIETEEHLRMALAAHADLGQGWLFGRPAALPAVMPWSARTLPRRRSLPAAPASDSPFEVVRAVLPTKRMTKPLLLAISKHLEQQALSAGPGAVVASAFQDASRFTPATRRRYTRLAEHAAFVAALGVGMDPSPAPGVRGAAIAPDDVLRGEWSVAVVGPHFAAALVAIDLGDSGPDDERRFEFALTYDRDLVIRAAAALMRRVHPIDETEAQ